MIRSTLTYVAATLIAVWLIVVVPGWIFAMLYAGELLLLPDGQDIQSWFVAAAFYLPPMVSAAIGFWLHHSKNRTNNAQN